MSKSVTADRALTDYQAEDDARTLERAHEVLGDGKRHRAAKQHAKKKLSALKGVLASKPLGGGK